MVDEDRHDTIVRLRRKARSIAIEAARAAPVLAMQLRALAARYEAEADELDEEPQRPFDS